MQPQDVDIVFLDAGHTYEELQADIDAWLPHVAADGILCGHDFCDTFPGVMRAVSELCGSAGIQVRIVNDTIVWMVAKAEYLSGLKARMREQEEEVEAARTSEPEGEQDVPAVTSESPGHNNHHRKAVSKREHKPARKTAAARQDQV
jgi:predicted glycoside hydrolase/deacetylase ChbG (UPF0249 family)